MYTPMSPFLAPSSWVSEGDKKHPVKALGIEVRGQSHAIGQASLDIQFIQNAVPIGCPTGGFRRLLLVDEPLGMLGLEIIVGIAKESLCSRDEFRIRIAKAQHGALVGWRSHGVHIHIVGEGWGRG